jgi:hypothetical protein
MPQWTNTNARGFGAAGESAAGAAATLEMPETCDTVLLFVNMERQNHERTVKPLQAGFS